MADRDRETPGSPFAAAWVAGFCILAALLTWFAFPPETVEAVMGEEGPVERITAAGYALCALAIWWVRDRADDPRSMVASCVVLVAFCLRELDWHKAFTGTSMLRLSWYAGPASPGAKAVAAAVLLVILTALCWLLWHHSRRVWQGCRRGQPIAVTLAAFVAMLLVAKSLDRSASILVEDFGVLVSFKWIALRTALEEWLELGLSMLVMLALAQHRAARRAA